MKIRQNVRHFAARKALEVPLVRDVVHDKLVDLHTRVFLERADAEHREERRDHLDAFFGATMDMYLSALQEGYTEAEAREITHVVANFDFYNHGWTEMMEFPGDEIDEHYARYEAFFEHHGVRIDEPLGEFRPDSLPEAPATPAKLDDPDWAHAEGGYDDDVYVEDAEAEVRRGDTDEPADVSVEDAPGVSDDDW
jgi:hypothetical protein